MFRIKNIIKKLYLLIIVFMCLPFSVFGVWVPDAWDEYPQEFHKIYKISSKYVAKGMDLENLTIKNFKGSSYTPTPIVEFLDLVGLAQKFKSDYKNKDVVGWLYVPKTNINYPVLKHPTDTNFYNNKNYEKLENKKKEYGFPGVIWIESSCNFKDKNNLSENIVFYGHNWENYTDNPKKDDFRDIMFSQLNSFHHFDYAKERPYIWVSTQSETFALKIFAVFYTEDEFQYHIANPNESQKKYIIEEAISRSRFTYNSPVYISDKIFTFSTCTRAYGKGRADQKFVIMARPLRDNENTNDILPGNYITEHKNHKEPKLKPIYQK
ncbi:MAG: class B sortase [Oscillospiraceae bacterium]|nr:class B sortase [Oscillospiraceae bacterium]